MNKIGSIKINNINYEFIEPGIRNYLNILKPNNQIFYKSEDKFIIGSKHDIYRVSYNCCSLNAARHSLSEGTGLPHTCLHNIIYNNEQHDRCRYLYLNFKEARKYIFNYIFIQDIRTQGKHILQLMAESSDCILLDIKHLYKIINKIYPGGINILNPKKDSQLLSLQNFNNFIQSADTIRIYQDYICDFENSKDYDGHNFINIEKNQLLQNIKNISTNINIYKNNLVYNVKEYDYNDMCFLMKSLYNFLYIFSTIERELDNAFFSPLEIYNNDCIYRIRKNLFNILNNYYESQDISINYNIYKAIDLVKSIKYINIKEIKFNENAEIRNKLDLLYYQLQDYFSYYLLNLSHPIELSGRLNQNRKKSYKLLLFLMWFGLNDYFIRQSIAINFNNGQGITYQLNKEDIDYVLLDIKYKFSKKEKKYTRISNYYIKVSYNKKKNKFFYQYINKNNPNIFLSDIDINDDSDIPVSTAYNMLDILWSDGNVTTNIRPITDNVTPIGLCVIPTGFLGENEKARFMALKYAGGTSDGIVGNATGSTSNTNQYLKWTLSSAKEDVSSLTNYNKLTSNISSPGVLVNNLGNLIGSGSTGDRIMLYTENNTWVGTEENNSFTGYAIGDIYGKENTTIISNLNSFSSYPAFVSVLSYYTNGTQAGDWYIPALGELVFIGANQTSINEKLSLINEIYSADCMSRLTTSQYYLCSSEYNSNYSFRLYFNTGRINNSSKTNNAYAIPMIQK